MSERMFRRGIRWAKVSGQRGAWRIAMGWRDEFKATASQTTIWKAHAEIIARGWINDQSEATLAIGRAKDQAEREDDARLKAMIGAEAFARIPRRARYLDR